ncbi:HNH endonuclease [Nocardiopsis alba]|uniref:HNH endonuclease n=1 Tax=Nocardiopsis alba TaxID=53437 RepID=UPI00369D74F5
MNDITTMDQLTEAIFGGKYLTPTEHVDSEAFLHTIPGYDPDIDGLGLDAAQCWIPDRVPSGTGYVYMYIKGSYWNMARVSYELFVGPIGEGKEPDHTCFTRNCINPHHLEAVSRRENILRSNNPCAQNARKKECKRGHAFDEENTYRSPSTGHRNCRECIRLRREGLI